MEGVLFLFGGLIGLLLSILVIRLGVDPIRSELAKIRVELEARNAADLGASDLR